MASDAPFRIDLRNARLLGFNSVEDLARCMQNRVVAKSLPSRFGYALWLGARARLTATAHRDCDWSHANPDMGDVLHVYSRSQRPSFAYELEDTDRINILVMLGRGVRQGAVIESKTWRVIAANLASRAHITRKMTVGGAYTTWLACRAVCKEF